MAQPDRFDADYYHRFYGDPATRVVSQGHVRKLAAFTVSYLRFLGMPLCNALDLGCGVGHWRTALKALTPRTSYQGVEYSAYLCERYGYPGWVRIEHLAVAEHLVVDRLLLWRKLADGQGIEAGQGVFLRYLSGVSPVGVGTPNDFRKMPTMA